MIVDSHAHVFTHWATAGSHDSPATRLRYAQQLVSLSSAPAIRCRDRGRVDKEFLWAGEKSSWANLADVGLRVGHFGQLECTVDGEEYRIQYFPVGMQELVSSPEFLLAQMDYVGVDHCILHAGSAYGKVSELNSSAQHRFPKRFTGLLHVDEGLAFSPAGVEELAESHDVLGLSGLYFSLHGLPRYGGSVTFNADALRPFFEEVARLRLPVFIELTQHPTYNVANYLANAAELDRLVAEFCDVAWILVIGPPLDVFRREDAQLPVELDSLFRRSNFYSEAAFPIRATEDWEYPFPEAQELLRALCVTYGADRFIWGSDMPNVERFCTYRQSLDYVARHCEFLDEREKSLVLGGTIERIFGLGAGGVGRGHDHAHASADER